MFQNNRPKKRKKKELGENAIFNMLCLSDICIVDYVILNSANVKSHAPQMFGVLFLKTLNTCSISIHNICLIYM